MHTIQLRNLPEEIYEGLKASAKASKRSMTQEAINALEIFLKNRNSVEEEKERKMNAFEELRQLHEKSPLPKIPFEWITEDRK